jgi:signal peptidase I
VTTPESELASAEPAYVEADERKPELSRESKRTRALFEWVGVIVGALAVAFVIRTFLFGAYVIPSGSMEPTLKYNPDDRVLVNKLSYKLHDINRGDVVVFTRPPGETDPTINDLIKRVIGLPGEKVELVNGVVLINGNPLTEPYVNKLCTEGTRPLDTHSSWVLPKHMIFVMGDNRCGSSDSRVFGPISEHLVVGRAFMRIWPPNRLGWL